MVGNAVLTDIGAAVAEARRAAGGTGTLPSPPRHDPAGAANDDILLLTEGVADEPVLPWWRSPEYHQFDNANDAGFRFRAFEQRTQARTVCQALAPGDRQRKQGKSDPNHPTSPLPSPPERAILSGGQGECAGTR